MAVELVEQLAELWNPLQRSTSFLRFIQLIFNGIYGSPWGEPKILIILVRWN